MRVDEALKVLNLEKELLAKPASEASGELEKQFERYFASNDPEKGGCVLSPIEGAPQEPACVTPTRRLSPEA